MKNGGKMSGYAPGDVLPNPKLKWETSTTLNLAVDFGFFRNRLSGTFELYKTNTTDLLVDRNIDASTGYSIMKDNIGEIENRGIELQLNGIMVSKKDFSFGAGIIFSANRNKIKKLFGDLDEDGTEDDYLANNWFKGQPMEVFWDWEAIGIWQEDEVDDIPNSAQPKADPGDVKILDKNDDGILDNEDREITSQFPDWLGTLNLYASFKGIDFSMDITTVQGITRYNGYLTEYRYGGDLRGIFNGIKVDYWTPENPTGNFPRPTNASTPANMYLLGKQDASFVKITNLTLGYSLPSRIVEKIKLNSLRFYFAGQNLVTFTDYSSYDPEQQPNDYPEARTISFGVQVGL
jgi:outer membrane receptor protein involved in Fe transport